MRRAQERSSTDIKNCNLDCASPFSPCFSLKVLLRLLLHPFLNTCLLILKEERNDWFVKGSTVRNHQGLERSSVLPCPSLSLPAFLFFLLFLSVTSQEFFRSLRNRNTCINFTCRQSESFSLHVTFFFHDFLMLGTNLKVPTPSLSFQFCSQKHRDSRLGSWTPGWVPGSGDNTEAMLFNWSGFRSGSHGEASTGSTL